MNLPEFSIQKAPKKAKTGGGKKKKNRNLNTMPYFANMMYPELPTFVNGFAWDIYQN